MKNVLIIGSTGQIGSELTMKLRSIYNGNIVAGYIPGAEPKGELAESVRLLSLISQTNSRLPKLFQSIILIPSTTWQLCCRQ